MLWAVHSHFRKQRGLILARVFGVALPLILIGLPAVYAQDRSFQFGLMGDTGYTNEDIEGFQRLLAHSQPVRWTDALYRRKFPSRLRFLSIRQASVDSDAR